MEIAEIKLPAKCTSKEGANRHFLEKEAKPLFSTSDVCAGLGGAGRFKIRIENKGGSRFINGVEVKHNPSAAELVEDNFPRKSAFADGMGTAGDIWSEEGDRKRRMGI